MFYYRFEGKQNTLGFGVYPDVTLENARRKAEEARSNLASCINPGAIRKQAKVDKQQTVENQKRLEAGLPIINNHLREGDVLHVHSIDRLARNLKDLQNIIEQFTGKGVSVKF